MKTLNAKPVLSACDAVRASLKNLLPGYKWTVHKPSVDLTATGIQSSGFNRCSTLEVVARAGTPWFEARIAGFGKRAKWLHVGCGCTLAKAIRGLQDGLQNEGQIYISQHNAMESARVSKL